MLSVYTDMGSNGTQTAVAYVILSDTDYVCSDCTLIEVTAQSSDVKELYAMYYALLKVEEIDPVGKEIVLYSDSANAIIVVERTMRSSFEHLDELNRIACEYNVRFSHVRSHTSSAYTVNMLADRLCSAKLKEARGDPT